MTTYRMPDGAEVSDVDLANLPGADGEWRWVEHPTLGTIFVSAKVLEQTMPAEPENGATLACDDVVFLRRDGWYASNGEERWYHAHLKEGGTWTWAQVVEFAPSKLVPLAPVVAAEPIQLPFVGKDRENDEITVECHGAVVYVCTEKSFGVDLFPDVARQTASAIWHAAQLVEERVS